MKRLILALGLMAWAPLSAVWAAQPDAAIGGQATQGAAPATTESPAAPAKAQTLADALGPPIGTLGGLRSRLSAAGLEFSLIYIGEVLGNASGGLRRGSIYEGRVELDIDADLDKLLGLRGAAIHASGFNIHGRGLTTQNLGNLLATSGIEARPSTRLFELWFEQKFADGKAALRIGQLAADTEFQVSQYGALFVNSTFGWPALSALDLPNGGPAYPLATPGVRLKLNLSDSLTGLFGVFNGDPAGPNALNAQAANRYGTKFRLSDQPLLIGELQWAYNQDKTSLPGTIHLGAWAHTRAFGDQRIGLDGLSLADPANLGRPANRGGDFAAYAMIDQQLYKKPGSDDGGIGFFARASLAPGNRNLVNFYVDSGLNFKGFVPGRPDDSFGLAGSFARISNRARGLDRDTVAFTGVDTPTRDYEAVLELTYQAQIVSGWTVQPDFQYVIHPGGKVSDPAQPSRPLRNAAVFGLRTTLQY